MKFILSSEIKCPKSGILLIINYLITRRGWSGKLILQVSIAVFSGAVEKFFGQRWLSPLEKMAHTPMYYHCPMSPMLISLVAVCYNLTALVLVLPLTSSSIKVLCVHPRERRAIVVIPLSSVSCGWALSSATLVNGKPEPSTVGDISCTLVTLIGTCVVLN